MGINIICGDSEDFTFTTKLVNLDNCYDADCLFGENLILFPVSLWQWHARYANYEGGCY